jgi:hypothetical protein
MSSKARNLFSGLVKVHNLISSISGKAIRKRRNATGPAVGLDRAKQTMTNCGSARAAGEKPWSDNKIALLAPSKLAIS